MKYKTLLKKLNLSEKDFSTIKDTVASAETKTTGEIAIAIAPESAHYSFWELLAANFAGAVVLLIMLPFSDFIKNIFRNS